MPASATASQAYSSGARSNAPTPPSPTSTTPLVSTANSASDEPATTASNTAATAPDQIRAPSTHNTSAGPITRATTAQVSSGARCWSDVGLPTPTMTATEIASDAAQNHSQAVTRRWVILALIGNANSNTVTCSAVTNITEPRLSAPACRA